MYFNPPRSTLMKIRLGAAPYRCAACRCNFASFKACKEKFAWRHDTRVDVPATAQLEALEEALEMFETPDHEYAPVGAIGPLDVLDAPSPSQARGVPVVSLKHMDMEPVDPFAELATYATTRDLEEEPEPFL